LGERSSALHHVVSDSLLAGYRAHLVARFGGPSDLKVAYTPLHGVGGATMTRLFAEAGFADVVVVAQQFTPDGTFPTLPFPNPEEPGALDPATALGSSVGADVVVANDPDADRLGVAVRVGNGWRALAGDEIGWLLASFLLPQCVSGDVVATSIVSSSMLEKMAAAAGVGYAQTLTGFKWVGRAAGSGRLAFGYEEALGYAVDSNVSDKDGMSAALAFCRLATELRSQGRSVLDRLDELALAHGVHAIGPVTVRAEGERGLAAIAETVERLAADPPARVGGVEVTEAADLSLGWRGLPPTSGVRWQLGETGRVVVRPSGTEPKLKAYVEVVTPVQPSLAEARERAAATLAAVRDDVTSLTTVVL
ncbi:MAG TPA: hypothetical protein VGS61_03465, partial [Acidimicrobiales bacterium]|nr:hypothetical protein [Acidimicrobiales bacterium]